MTCNLAEGARIEFLNSGVIVEVHNLSTQSDNSKLSHARVTVSSEAGKVIRKKGIDAEPVHVTIGGVVQNRYLFPKESLEIRREEADFRLYDARKILERGVISQNFEEVNVGDITQFIFDQRDDPQGVLTDIRIVDNELLEAEKQTTKEDLTEYFLGSHRDAAQGNVSSAIEDALALTRDFIGFLGKGRGMPYNEYKGIEFEDTSPNDGLKRVEQDFGFTSWVGDDGVLWLGFPGSVPNNRHAVSGIPGDKNYSMREYNVTEGAFNVSLVKVTGETHWFGGGGKPSDELYPIAEVWVEDPDTGEVADGKIISPDEPKPIWNLASLEQAARNMLIGAAMNYRNGNIIFNGMASTQQENLATMSVGDIIMVADYVEEHCSNDAASGSYIVTSTQHKFSPKSGWKITCEVGLIPSNIQSMSVYYNASDDEAYDDLKAYRTKRRGGN